MDPNKGIFKYQNPRQERIYNKLLLIGPGPASFYRDACFLNSECCGLATSSHLIFHLFREIESAIRDILLQINPIPFKNDGQNNHKREIYHILEVLELSKNEPIIQKWIDYATSSSLHTLPMYAHRDGLFSPRIVSNEIREQIDIIERIFDYILSVFEVNYLKVIDYIDTLLIVDIPSEKDIKYLLSHCPNNTATHRYFFNNLQNYMWLKPLYDCGFFQRVPGIHEHISSGDKYYLPWPASSYLSRMAPKSPEPVLDIILNTPPTSNYLVHSDFLEALLNLSSALSVKAEDKIISWIDAPSVYFNGEKYCKLILHLLNGNEITPALNLFKHLFSLKYNEGSQRYSYCLASLFENFWYKEFMQQLIPLITKFGEMDSFLLLSNMLGEAIHDLGNKEPSKLEWFSFDPPSIEDHEQNEHHDDPIDILIFAFRDVSESMMSSHGIDILNHIEKKNILYTRIDYYLRSKYTDIDMQGTERLIASNDLCDSHIYHETYNLLKTCYGKADDKVKEEYLCRITEYSNDLSNFQDNDEKNEIIIARSKIWLFRSLYPIQNYLNETWRLKFNEFKEQFGEIEHPDFNIYVGSGGWGGFSSPKTSDELSTMSTEELLSFLKEIKPADDPFDDTFEGISIILKNLTFSDPNKYASELERYKGVQPAFIRGILSGIQEDIKANGNLRLELWENILLLCNWIVDQERNEPHRIKGHYAKLDSGWGWTRTAIVDLLQEGLKQKEREIPYKYRILVWYSLNRLVEDPNPTSEDEVNDDGKFFDPANLAINTVRGRAMHTVIYYASWVRRNIKKNPDGEKELSADFNIMPEVREVLNRHLDLVIDSSHAIRSFYGKMFPQFFIFDEKWASESVGKIFSHDSASSKYWESAWDSYVLFNRPYSKRFSVLKEEYIYAIKSIGGKNEFTDRFSHPDESLANHLMALYWWGDIELLTPEELLPKFFQNASDELRGKAIEFIGRNLSEANIKTLARIMQLWDNRIHNGAGENELSAFGYWFICKNKSMDKKWLIDQLLLVLSKVEEVDNEYLVARELCDFVTNYPFETLECMDRMIDKAKSNWRLPRIKDEVREILSATASNSNSEVKKQAVGLVHKMGSLGFIDFRDLLKS